MSAAHVAPLLFVAALAACSDQGVTALRDPPQDEPTDTGDFVPDSNTSDTSIDTSIDTSSVVIPDEGDYVDCAAAGLTEGQWWGSMPFATEADLTDGSGRPFWSVDFDLKDWSTVSNPDAGHCPSGSDKAYRVPLTLSAAGPGIWLDLQSDDGLWVWVNGTEVGHWGGDWQEEGCVNDKANCAEFVEAAPAEITALLHPGENVLAVRVSNAINQAYMGVRARCVE